MTELQRILHVEDDDSIRLLTKVALETVGKLEVESCASGYEALEKISAFKPQVILLDVMMPGLDGPATLTELKDKHPLDTTLVLFMTAKVQQKELDHFRSLGAYEVITKPFDPMTLSEQIKSFWTSFTLSQ